MEKTTLSELLNADSQKLMLTLLANADTKNGIRQSTNMLEEEMSRLLFKYNAASCDDTLAQTVSECMMNTARDQLALLSAVETVTEKKNKKTIEPQGVIALLLAVIFFLGGILLYGIHHTAGFVCLIFPIFFAYLSGRTWRRETAASVYTRINPERLLYVLKRTAETMDRKMEEFAEKSAEWETTHAAGKENICDNAFLSPDTLSLYGDLLEALCSGNGEFALKQLEKLPRYLKKHGITTEYYNGENASLFELLPTKKERTTLRPALCLDEKLLTEGRATETEQ